MVWVVPTAGKIEIEGHALVVSVLTDVTPLVSAEAKEQATAALKAAESAKDAADEAITLVKKAAEDSEHDLVLEAIKGYEKAL